MNNEIQEDIIHILDDTVSTLKKKDYIYLREISNKSTHNSSIYSDQDAVSIAVVIYSLFKITSRDFYDEKLNSFLIREFDNAKKFLERNKISAYRKIIRNIFNMLSRKDREIKKYLKEIVIAAQKTKGSRLYEHGISLATAADMLGVSHWDLMSYVGKTGIPEAFPMGETFRKRLNTARKLFGI